jgi:hypothetical protein
VLDYIGKDSMGRPVLLHTVRHGRFSKIKDLDKYLDYHFYFFTVYLQEQMEGWVDTFGVIFDAADQISDNTNLSMTKRLVCEAYKTILGQCKYIVVSNVNTITRMLTKVIFPLLPKEVVNVVSLYGDERGPLLQKLREHMDDNTIPDFLGGRNTHVFDNSATSTSGSS